MPHLVSIEKDLWVDPETVQAVGIVDYEDEAQPSHVRLVLASGTILDLQDISITVDQVIVTLLRRPDSRPDGY